ncbi:hypothetical protein Tco_0735282 [Tanacetum coccineum]
MDDPNLTMEEYIRLEEEKARRRGQNFDWKSATYGKVKYFEDINYFRDFKTEFPAIVFNNISTQTGNSIKTQYKALPPRDHRYSYLRFEGLEYSKREIDNFEERLGKIFSRGFIGFEEAVLELDTAGALQVQLGVVRHRISWRGTGLDRGLDRPVLQEPRLIRTSSTPDLSAFTTTI